VAAPPFLVRSNKGGTAAKESVARVYLVFSVMLFAVSCEPGDHNVSVGTYGSLPRLVSQSSWVFSLSLFPFVGVLLHLLLVRQNAGDQAEPEAFRECFAPSSLVERLVYLSPLLHRSGSRGSPWRSISVSLCPDSSQAVVLLVCEP